MILNSGVKILGIRPELMLSLIVADKVWFKFAKPELVITSITDSKHSTGSLHYSGAAADLRSRDLNKEELDRVVKELKNRLSDDFDVVVESDHIHLEYQPK